MAEIQHGIPIHQWERGKASRNILTAPEGYLLAEFDASGQEMRLMADASQDATMLSLFEQDIDTHAYMGAAIERLDWHWIHDEQDNDPKAKSARYLGKFANLSLQYRIGVDTMMVRALTGYDLQLTHARASHIKETYKSTYPGVPAYWNAAIQFARAKGYAETKGHRRLATPNMSSWEQQQTAINLPIQGTGADMKSLAIAVGTSVFDNNLIYGWDLHDALFLFVKDDAKAKGRVVMFQELLNNLPYEKAWGWHPSVALPWDAKYGKTWGTLKGVDK